MGPEIFSRLIKKFTFDLELLENLFDTKKKQQKVVYFLKFLGYFYYIQFIVFYLFMYFVYSGDLLSARHVNINIMTFFVIKSLKDQIINQYNFYSSLYY